MTPLADGPNAWGCYDPQCPDSTWDHDCPVVPVTKAKTRLTPETVKALAAEAEAGYDPDRLRPRPAAEPPLSAADWAEIFSTVPPYPLELPDELRRTIAQAAIVIRQAAADMERGRRIGSILDYQMPMSLLASCLNRMGKYAP